MGFMVDLDCNTRAHVMVTAILFFCFCFLFFLFSNIFIFSLSISLLILYSWSSSGFFSLSLYFIWQILIQHSIWMDATSNDKANKRIAQIEKDICIFYISLILRLFFSWLWSRHLCALHLIKRWNVKFKIHWTVKLPIDYK